MREWTLKLPFPRPPEGLHANDRCHWRVKAQSTASVRDLVMLLCRSQRVPKMQRVSVQVVWVVPDHRKRDADNCAPLLKAIFDAIGSDRGTSAHLVPDDDPEHMVKPQLIIEHRPGPAHFEIHIQEIT